MSTKDMQRLQALSWEFWDSKTLGASDLSTTLFKAPTTTNGNYSSNYPSNGVLDAGETFSIDGISWAAEFDISAVNLIKLTKGYLTLKVADRVHAELLMRRIPGGGGIAGFTNAALATGQTDAPANGVPHVGNVYKISPVLTIDAGTQMRVEINWPVTPGALLFWVVLSGVRTRPGA